MAQIDIGLRKLLTFPRIYDAFQTLIGSDDYRRWYIRDLLRPRPGMTILDIGCGPGSMLRFLPHDVQYLGFDMNPKYIDYARRRFGNRGTFQTQKVGDAQVTTNGCDVVMANAILHHLDDAEAAHLIDIAWHQLKPGGILLTYDNAWTPDQSRAAKALIARDRGQHVRSPEQYLALARVRFADVETTLRHDGYRIPYTLFTMKAVRPA